VLVEVLVGIVGVFVTVFVGVGVDVKVGVEVKAHGSGVAPQRENLIIRLFATSVRKMLLSESTATPSK